MRTKQHKMNTKSASKVHQPALFRPCAEHKKARKNSLNVVFKPIFSWLKTPYLIQNVIHFFEKMFVNDYYL